jgi:tetratricopeptide (TPR) repeat protein
MIRLGMHSQAKPIIEQALVVSEVQQGQELPYLLLSRAEICAAESDYACAHQLTDRAMSLVAPESDLCASAHAIRASTWQRCGKHTSAIREFEAAIEIASRNPCWKSSAEATDLLELYSISLQKCGRRKQARSLLREIQQRKRIDPTP